MHFPSSSKAFLHEKGWWWIILKNDVCTKKSKTLKKSETISMRTPIIVVFVCADCFLLRNKAIQIMGGYKEVVIKKRWEVIRKIKRVVKDWYWLKKWGI